MATLTLNMSSEVLNGDVAVTYFLPEKYFFNTNEITADIPVLYLLHGYGGSNTVYQRFTTLEAYARNHKIIIVMPDGKNSFYRDAVYGQKYYTFVQEELQTFTQNIFPISKKPEHTFIAGNSMGGYGALNLALQEPKKYGAIGLFSALTDITFALERQAEYGFQIRQILDMNTESVRETINDNYYLLKQQDNLPPILQLCGTEDFLLEQNQEFAKKMEAFPDKHQYIETPGAHDWNYWEMCLKEFINWLPIDTIE